DRDRLLLVRQYRYVARRSTWEMPTGGVRAGETLEQAAQRELAEEVGHRARRLVPLSTYHTSKSVVDETAHLFLAEGLYPERGRRTTQSSSRSTRSPSTPSSGWSWKARSSTA